MKYYAVQPIVKLMGFWAKMSRSPELGHKAYHKSVRKEQAGGPGGLENFCCVWLVRCDSPRGKSPALATALEPAEPEPMPRRLAEAYVEAFNRAARAKVVGVRAVAVPVEVCASPP